MYFLQLCSGFEVFVCREGDRVMIEGAVSEGARAGASVSMSTEDDAGDDASGADRRSPSAEVPPEFVEQIKEVKSKIDNAPISSGTPCVIHGGLGPRSRGSRTRSPRQG